MIWLDAHLSPTIARWIETELGHDCVAIRDIGLLRAADDEIFGRARDEKQIFMTKDQDFADLVTRLGAPPAVIWLRVGNTSEGRLKGILTDHLQDALDLIDGGNSLVEISAR